MLLRLIAAVLLCGVILADEALNGDFSAAADGNVAAWRIEGKPAQRLPPAGTVELPSGVSVAVQQLDGVRALCLAGHGVAAADFALVQSSPIAVGGGFRYTLSAVYRAKGLLPDDIEFVKSCQFVCEVFFEGGGASRLVLTSNSKAWVPLRLPFRVPEAAERLVVRLVLHNRFSGNETAVAIGRLVLTPEDAPLPNPGFEDGDGELPKAWQPTGNARTAWSEEAHAGRRALLVADAGAGALSGWACEVPLRCDRVYRFGGWITTGDLRSDGGAIPGAAFVLQYLDAAGDAVGQPAISPAVGAQAGWTEVATPEAPAPATAVRARLSCGLQFCRGIARFDDVHLDATAVASATAQMLRRAEAKPSSGVHYATNLLAHPTVEDDEGGVPAGWHFVGRSDPDWSEAELEGLYTALRPAFGLGRAKGEWSRDAAYEGRGALVLTSVDPPRSPRRQWYGQAPVDGYWQSDAMPCAAGKAYLASTWLKPGILIDKFWCGPLEIQFFNAGGGLLRAANDPRAAWRQLDPGAWSFYATRPWVAPPGAIEMRLRFGQELSADAGGWGRLAADNLAVWELPPGIAVPTYAEVPISDADRFQAWFIQAHVALKPPYLSAPPLAPAYDSVWGASQNTVPGNCFSDPALPVDLRFTVFNLLGETRTLAFRVVRSDWLGEQIPPLTPPAITLAGSSAATVTVAIPALGRFGTCHVQAEVCEGAAVVGTLSARYAVLPPLTRPRTAENPWAATPLSPTEGIDCAYETELGGLLKTAGFGTAWVRLSFNAGSAEDLAAQIAKAKRTVAWYRSLGMRSILQLYPRNLARPIEAAPFAAMGRSIATAFAGEVQAYGDWGIEISNSGGYFREIPRGGGERMSDQEYDSILAGFYEGLKGVSPGTPVLIGNVASEWDGKTIHRLYQAPVNGRFDGSIMNCYNGIQKGVLGHLKAFDQHGGTNKVVYQEENADQRSPCDGEARRYGEVEGAANMVRVWTSMYARSYPRLKTMTFWGVVDGAMAPSDITMLSPNLQPRPHFLAHAVMADQLADATFVAERSLGEVVMLEWKRGDGEAYLLWATSGERRVNLSIAKPTLGLVDLMGNVSTLPARGGVVALTVTPMPVYLVKGGPVTLGLGK